MTKVTRVLTSLAFCLAMALSSLSQTLPVKGGLYNADDYASWVVKISPGSPIGSGSQTYQLQTVGAVSLPTGRNVQLFATNAPVLIGSGSNQETATPTAVSGCNFVGNQLGQCTITISTTNTHGPGDIIQSGTAGLQEAINDASISGGTGGAAANGSGEVVVDGLWRRLYGGTTAMLQAASFALNATFEPNAVVVRDVSLSGESYWFGAPGLTNITVPTALTTASTLTTATTGGTIATATTPRFCITAVDQFGGETACSADAAGTATLVDGAGSTNSYTITAAGVPTGTGIVGYRLYVSASGGATQSETLAAPAQLSGTVAPLCPLPGCMAPGVAIVLTALPATTAAGPPSGTSGAATAINSAHTTVVTRQAGIRPSMLPFSDTAAPGYWPVTVTSATTLAVGFDVMGELQYPANYFNTLGSAYRICGGGVVTPSAATVAGTWAIRIGPRQNSAGTAAANIAVPFGWVASTTWTAALYHFDFCTDITVTTTGTSGVVEGSATNFCAVISGGAAATNIVTCVDAFNAASSAIDLTQQGVVQLSYVQTAASWTLPQLRYMTIRRL